MINKIWGATFAFTAVMLLSAFLKGRANVVLFLIGAAGFIIGLVAVHVLSSRLHKYWHRCRTMLDDFTAKMVVAAAHGDFETAEQFKRRGKRVLDLWGESLEKERIPQGRDLEDL